MLPQLNPNTTALFSSSCFPLYPLFSELSGAPSFEYPGKRNVTAPHEMSEVNWWRNEPSTQKPLAFESVRENRYHAVIFSTVWLVHFSECLNFNNQSSISQLPIDFAQMLIKSSSNLKKSGHTQRAYGKTPLGPSESNRLHASRMHLTHVMRMSLIC